jgi:hypothetical protein
MFCMNASLPASPAALYAFRAGALPPFAGSQEARPLAVPGDAPVTMSPTEGLAKTAALPARRW